MKNMLVTGGAGFIGSNFVRYVLRNLPEVRVINLDKLTYAGATENLADLPSPERHTFIHGSIGDANIVESILEREQIDTIINFAAETHVDRSILQPAPFIETNIQGTFILLEAARRYWTDHGKPEEGFRFHHISTDEVYGSLLPGEAAWTEESPYQPTSPYAASKAAADHLVRAYGATYRLPFTITNCTNNYGPYQFPEKLVPLTISSALADTSIPIYGDGKQERDWLHVEDHCAGILAVLERGVAGQSYHLSSGVSTTNIALVMLICDLLDELQPLVDGRSYADLMVHVTDRAGHDRRYALDSGKARRELSWLGARSLRDGLKAVVQWYLDHIEWLEQIRNRSEYRQWMKIQYQQEE